MRRTLVIRYLQILFFIIIGSINFLNALKTADPVDWIIYAVCMIGIIVVAFSIRKVREDIRIAEGKEKVKEVAPKAGKKKKA